jgi:hypothetical protein
MYIVDPYNSARKWQLDIMLDASGEYGVRNSIRRKPNSDIVMPSSPTTISIDSYRRYFYELKGEILYTYSYIIDETIGQNIRILIENTGSRRPLACASKASYLLERTGLFPDIKTSRYPINIKKICDKFEPVNKEIMDISDKSSYDLEVYP